MLNRHYLTHGKWTWNWDADAKVIRDGWFGQHSFLKPPVCYDICVSVPIIYVFLPWVNACLTQCLDSVTFNQDGPSPWLKSSRTFVWSSTAHVLIELLHCQSPGSAARTVRGRDQRAAGRAGRAGGGVQIMLINHNLITTHSQPRPCSALSPRCDCGAPKPNKCCVLFWIWLINHSDWSAKNPPSPLLKWSPARH